MVVDIVCHSRNGHNELDDACTPPSHTHDLYNTHSFGKDVIVDLVCYRRNGHNELDDARATLPLTCAAIDAHPPVLELYGAKLQVRVKSRPACPCLANSSLRAWLSFQPLLNAHTRLHTCRYKPSKSQADGVVSAAELAAWPAEVMAGFEAKWLQRTLTHTPPVPHATTGGWRCVSVPAGGLVG